MPKRLTAAEHDRSRTSIPLAEVVNFGPVTRAELEAIGVTTLEQLEALGVEAVAGRWVEAFPERANANALLALIATVDGGVTWTEASDAQRAWARRLARQLRPA